MKPSSPAPTRGAPSPVKARNCALMNQLATPGLGSLMGGRTWAGAGQLALALIGFGLVGWWFVKTVIVSYYGLMFDQQSEPPSYARWGWAGVTVFAASWFWALISSLSIYRQAKAGQRAEFSAKLGGPPVLRSP
jgi:hypothetical protein